MNYAGIIFDFDGVLLEFLRGLRLEAFDKDAVIRQLRSWYARRGCAVPPIVPPTFFLREPGDCAALLAHTTTAEGARGDNETTLWYLKDPSGGSHGKGVRGAATGKAHTLFGSRDAQARSPISPDCP